MPAANYYLTNLEHLLEWVEAHHSHLIDASTRTFAERFRRLPVAAKRLYVRLLMRRGPLFRIDRLRYPEVGPSWPAVLTLCLGGLGSLSGAAGWRERIVLLRNDELGERLAGRRSRSWIRHARRPELLQAVLDEGPDLDPPIPEALRLLGLEELEVLRLLYFGNGRQDLVEFILADLGVLRFEQVALKPSLPWCSPAEVRRDLACLRGADWLSSHGDRRDVPADEAALLALEVLLAQPAVASTTEARRNRALSRLAQAWRRLGHFERALSVLEHASGPPAREARCRLLARLGRADAAAIAQQQLTQQPGSDAEADFGARFDPLTARCRVRIRSGGLPRRRMTLVRANPEQRIEQVVMGILAHGGGRALHVENGLIGLLVGLAFWDIVFDPLPGAFVQPFQSGPVDLFDPAFRRRRAAAIDRRLEEVASGSITTEDLIDFWEHRHGTVNALVPWFRFTTADVRSMLVVLPPAMRAWLCDTALQDPALLRRGFPDLLVLGDAPRCFTFMEVKGPGDVLRTEQRRWMEALVSAHIPAHVLEVRWA